jgi:hypothetical protein
MEFLMKKNALRLRLVLFSAFLFLSCASSPGSGLSVTRFVEFAGRKLSGIPYRGGLTIDYGTVHYSQAFYHGWIEFTADYVEGEGIIGITQGALKRGDTLITGTEALGILRNRLDRIEALVRWMEQSGYARRFDEQAAFEEYWRPILLPETVAKKKRPAGYPAAPPAFVAAEGYRWNTAYTALLFPDTPENPENAELAKMRDSGTLLRDFEEAALWIFFQAGLQSGADRPTPDKG